MFPGVGLAFMLQYRVATWDIPSKAPDVVVTGSGKIIEKTTTGPGGARGNMPRVKN